MTSRLNVAIVLGKKLNVVYCWPSLLLLLLALAFVIVVTVESACDGRFVPFSSKYEVWARQNVAAQVEIVSIFAIFGKNHEESSILEAKLTACPAPTTSRGDLTHKSAVMYDQVRATRLIVKGKSLAFVRLLRVVGDILFIVVLLLAPTITTISLAKR